MLLGIGPEVGPLGAFEKMLLSSRSRFSGMRLYVVPRPSCSCTEHRPVDASKPVTTPRWPLSSGLARRPRSCTLVPMGMGGGDVSKGLRGSLVNRASSFESSSDLCSAHRDGGGGGCFSGVANSSGDPQRVHFLAPAGFRKVQTAHAISFGCCCCFIHSSCTGGPAAKNISSNSACVMRPRFRACRNSSSSLLGILSLGL